jgi:hypothetical protein
MYFDFRLSFRPLVNKNGKIKYYFINTIDLIKKSFKLWTYGNKEIVKSLMV